MRCNLCEQHEQKYEYYLCDGSKIFICEECGEKLYGKLFIPIIDSRLFHIIMLLEYVEQN